MPLAHTRSILPFFSGAICVVGHTCPVWLKFKGGKGVATSAGVIFGLMPLCGRHRPSQSAKCEYLE